MIQFWVKVTPSAHIGAHASCTDLNQGAICIKIDRFCDVWPRIKRQVASSRLLYLVIYFLDKACAGSAD